MYYMMYAEIYRSSMHALLSNEWRECRNVRKTMPDNFLQLLVHSPILLAFIHPNTSENSHLQLQLSHSNFHHCFSRVCMIFLVCCQVSIVLLNQLVMSFSLQVEAKEAAASTNARRGLRQRQQPLTLQAEQEVEVLSRMERADVEAALLLSLHEEDAVDAEAVEIRAVESDEEEDEDEQEKEEKKEADPLDWNTPAHALLRAPVPLPVHASVGSPRRLGGEGHPTRLQLLQLFLRPDLVESWADLTNAAAPYEWLKTDAKELLSFIGVHLYMGIDSLPAMRMYWQEETRHPVVANLLSRDRFDSLNRYFTVSERDVDAAPRNPFSSIRDFITALNHSFPQHWIPGRHIALDESMVSYRGRSDIKQFVPGKSHPHGYKIWVLANENYVLQFQLYEGKAAAGPSIHDMVMQLTQLYRNSHHVLYIDTLFTSPTLVDSLFNVGIRVCGSVKGNRIGMPSKEQLSTATTDSLASGAALQIQKGGTKVLTLCAWKDKRLILLLYNHIDPRLSTSLQRWNEAGEIYQLGCPQAISDYFHHARAVDVINQLHYSYLPGRKSRKCWTRLVWWLIDICVLNAYRLWQCDHPTESHLNFRIALMHELMDQVPEERRPHRQSTPPHAATALAKDHYPMHVSEQRDCIVCSKASINRKRTTLICHACQVHLCSGDCWSQHHTHL